ncbi:hypothetical protein ACFLT7_06050 [candidate division KSB1 bacterium]
MSDPKYKTILDTIAAGLSTISSTGGYNNTVKKVFRTSQNVLEIPGSSLPCIVLLHGSETVEDETSLSHAATLDIPLFGVVSAPANTADSAASVNRVFSLSKDVRDWFDTGDNYHLGLDYVSRARLQNLRPFVVPGSENRPFFTGRIIVEYYYDKGSA